MPQQCGSLTYRIKSKFTAILQPENRNSFKMQNKKSIKKIQRSVQYEYVISSIENKQKSTLQK